MSHHKNIIKEKIQNFETAINSADVNHILSFYSEDALFMPENIKTLKKNEIGKSESHFFIKKDFKIQFDDIKIAVSDNYAFVEAVAKTSENDFENSSKLENTSRDFFVFRQEENQWKIFRYVFNNVKKFKIQ